MHTLTHGELSPFQLCAARGADAALVGSVDAFSIAQLLEALRRIGVPRPGGQAVLDATDLEFIDVRALRELDRHAADAGATLVLRSPPYPRAAADGAAGPARGPGGADGPAGVEGGAVADPGTTRRAAEPVRVYRAGRWGVGRLLGSPDAGRVTNRPRSHRRSPRIQG